MFVLADAFRTGFERLDEEHHELIVRINAVADAERNSPEGLFAALSDFRDALAHHFLDEEAQLEALAYPARGVHGLHHKETLAALDAMVAELAGGATPDGGAAAACFHELIRVVLIRDMEFVNWLAERGHGSRTAGRVEPREAIPRAGDLL